MPQNGTTSHLPVADEQLSGEERRSLYEAKLRKRGEDEPKPPQPGDVTTVGLLYSLAGHVVKYSKDNGATWYYALLGNYPEYFTNDAFGFAILQEFDPHERVGRRGSLLDRDFWNGAVVRPVKPSEYRRLTFSYDFALTPPLAVSEEVLRMLLATERPELPRKLKKALGKDPASRTKREAARVLRLARCL